MFVFACLTPMCCCVSQGQLGRIAAIYIPFLGIILDNLNRLNAVQEASGKHTELHHMYSSSSRFSNSSSFLNLKESGTTSVGTPKSLNRFTMHLDGNSSARASTHFRDSSYFAAIAGQGKIYCALTSDITFTSDIISVSFVHPQTK